MWFLTFLLCALAVTSQATRPDLKNLKLTKEQHIRSEKIAPANLTTGTFQTRLDHNRPQNSATVNFVIFFFFFNELGTNIMLTCIL